MPPRADEADRCSRRAGRYRSRDVRSADSPELADSFDAPFVVAVGLEDDAAWIADQEARAIAALGAPSRAELAAAGGLLAYLDATQKGAGILLDAPRRIARASHMAIDAAVDGNAARFINHACDPNRQRERFALLRWRHKDE